MSARKRKAAFAPSQTDHDESAGQTIVEKSGTTQQSMSSALRRQPVWLLLAVASGACAAFNGVFAKLTTTQLTTDIAAALARVLNLAPDNKFFEYLTRAFFFGCNLLFNVAMWAFFTAALTRASSTTRVSIINVSSNFMVTAILGLMIFGEKLPGLWWLGAGLLAVGNVIIGRREEAEKLGGTVGLDETREEAERLLDEIQDGAAIGSRSGTTESVELRETPLVDTGELGDEQSRIKKGEEADDPI